MDSSVILWMVPLKTGITMSWKRITTVIAVYTSRYNSILISVKLIEAIPGSGERILRLTWSLVKAKGSPAPGALGRGTFRLLLKTNSTFRMHSPQTKHNPNQLYCASHFRYNYWLYSYNDPVSAISGDVLMLYNLRVHYSNCVVVCVRSLFRFFPKKSPPPGEFERHFG